MKQTRIPKYRVGQQVRVLAYDGDIYPTITDIEITNDGVILYHTYHPDKPFILEDDVLGPAPDDVILPPYPARKQH